MTWLYIFKERSKVHRIIELFNKEIKKSFLTSIHVLPIDNLVEFMKNDISTFCIDNEIIHQIFLSHTSQQNSIAKRKHRHYPKCCPHADDSHACYPHI